MCILSSIFIAGWKSAKYTKKYSKYYFLFWLVQEQKMFLKSVNNIMSTLKIITDYALAYITRIPSGRVCAFPVRRTAGSSVLSVRRFRCFPFPSVPSADIVILTGSGQEYFVNHNGNILLNRIKQTALRLHDICVLYVWSTSEEMLPLLFCGLYGMNHSRSNIFPVSVYSFSCPTCIIVIRCKYTGQN